MTVFRHIFRFLLFIAVIVFYPLQSEGATVENIRLGSQNGSAARVVIDLSDKA